MTNLKQRVLTGTILAILIITSILGGVYSFTILILAINLLSLMEFYQLFHLYTLRPRNILGTLFSEIILISFTLVIANSNNWRILLINIIAAFCIFLLELYLKSATPFQNLSLIFFGIICITIPLCFFIGIAFFTDGPARYQQQLILGYFFILWASDTGAYFVGKNMGKRHLFKRISPNKTWEGSIGGMITALLIAYFTSLYFTTLHTADWMCIALIIVVIGTFGDLIKSMMKRSLNLKDSGTILPGHGGMLDRFDSLLSSAPFVFCYLKLFMN